MMTIVNHALANITFLLSVSLFCIVFMRLLKTKKRTLNSVLDGLLAIAYSGLAIIILCTKTYHIDIPMIIILVVLIIKYFKGWNDKIEVRL